MENQNMNISNYMEDVLENYYWEFDTKRKTSCCSERDYFKQFMRRFARETFRDNLNKLYKKEDVLEWAKTDLSHSPLNTILIKEYNDTTLKFYIYTNNNRYCIVACDDDKTYLGCTSISRMSRPGEDWQRGNDLPDGRINKETWYNILKGILRYELCDLPSDAIRRTYYLPNDGTTKIKLLNELGRRLSSRIEEETLYYEEPIDNIISSEENNVSNTEQCNSTFVLDQERAEKNLKKLLSGQFLPRQSGTTSARLYQLMESIKHADIENYILLISNMDNSKNFHNIILDVANQYDFKLVVIGEITGIKYYSINGKKVSFMKKEDFHNSTTGYEPYTIYIDFD